MFVYMCIVIERYKEGFVVMVINLLIVVILGVVGGKGRVLFFNLYILE